MADRAVEGAAIDDETVVPARAGGGLGDGRHIGAGGGPSVDGGGRVAAVQLDQAGLDVGARSGRQPPQRIAGGHRRERGQGRACAAREGLGVVDRRGRVDVGIPVGAGRDLRVRGGPDRQPACQRQRQQEEESTWLCLAPSKASGRKLEPRRLKRSRQSPGPAPGRPARGGLPAGRGGPWYWTWTPWCCAASMQRGMPRSFPGVTQRFARRTRPCGPGVAGSRARTGGHRCTPGGRFGLTSLSCGLDPRRSMPRWTPHISRRLDRRSAGQRPCATTGPVRAAPRWGCLTTAHGSWRSASCCNRPSARVSSRIARKRKRCRAVSCRRSARPSPTAERRPSSGKAQRPSCRSAEAARTCCSARRRRPP